jgi:hypothetical protein
MRRSATLLIAALGLGAALPAMASLPVKPAIGQTTAPMEEGEFRALLGRAIPLAQSDQCSDLLQLTDPAVPRLSGKDRDVVQLLRIPCLGASGRGNEVPGIYAEMIAVEPNNPMIRSVGVFVAAATSDYVEAGKRLSQLAEDNPEALNAITSALARGIAQQLTQANQIALRDRLFLALARADWQPQDRPDMRDSLAQGAIEALLEKKQVDEASTLLPRVTMPELLASMATERLYEPLWPAIEARLGPHSEKAVDPFAIARLADLSRNPNDERVLRDAVRAFLLLGRYPEASELAGRVPVADGMSEEAVTIVRYHAQALSAEGKPADAIARMKPFTTLDVAKTPAAVSGLVSLAEVLDENGREPEAFDVARDALARSGDAVSPWGVSWLKRTQACALGAMGRKAEANAIGDTLRANVKDNEAAAIEGLLCLGRLDDAAKLAVATLATSEGAGNLVDQFQPDGAFWASSPSRLRALWAPLLARPDVKAAFNKRARILPRALWPQRSPRPIPRGPDAPAGGNVA